MRSTASLLSCLCLLWLSGCASRPSARPPGEHRVSGELKAVEGRTLPVAHVILTRLGDDVSKHLARTQASPEGRFSLVAPGPGDYSLWLAAPGHPTQNVYLQVLADAPDLSLQATLEPYDYLETPKDLFAIGSWNNRDYNQAEPLRAQPDGTWVLERAVEGDSVTYLLQGLTADQSPTSCLGGEGQELDDDGYFWCRLSTPGGRLRLVLDPRALPRSPGPHPLQTAFAPPYAFLDPLNALHSRARTQSRLVLQRMMSARGGPPAPFDSGTLPRELLEFARDTRQPSLSRQLAALDLLGLGGYSLSAQYSGEKGEALGAELLHLLPVDSPRWALEFSSPGELSALMKPSDQPALLESFVERNPDEMVQLYALSLLLEDATERKDTQAVTTLLERIQARRHPFAMMVLSRHAMRAQPMDGKPAPAFSAPLLEGGGTVSRESLLGRYYLIDFWATWCKGCVEQLPLQEAAVEKFKGRGGFTILSVSLDTTAEQVKRFRESRWKMPWMHVLNGEDPKTSLSEAFQVYALPMAVLVDVRGVIVASGNALHGEQLEKTLEAKLPKK